MVTCKNCSSANSLDSAFCKKCGANLPEDEITAARERLELVVADGLKIFSAGRVDEAMQIADQAVAANPHSKAALSLKAMCHERRGEISDAIECHERVLDLDPDSMIDRIKVKDLRNLLVTRSSIAAVPDRRMAIAGAVAAFVLVASIGVLAARTANREEVPQKMASNIASSELPNSVQNSVQNTNGQPDGGQTSTGVPGGGTAQQPQDQHVQQPAGAQQQPTGTRPLNDRSEIQLPDAPSGGTLPRPTNSMPPREISGPITFTKDDLKPILSQRGPTKPTSTGVPNPTTNHDPDPTPTEDRSTAPPVKRDAPGIMEIKVVGRGGQSTDGGSAPSSAGGNGVEALMRTARSQYQLGNWASAAQSFERALRAGGDPASGNQRLAQCYEKLGRTAEAVAAYNRAIDAFQSALGSGSGDKDRIQSALDSCRQAVKVLGG